jgi:hypothetical protein
MLCGVPWLFQPVLPLPLLLQHLSWLGQKGQASAHGVVRC